ncbi:MAG: hypothetical protein P1V51_14915 [Deltaproteobacteria bacterium]|nr:hypothetical protein [Deltaproteobacteria bacterium]
MSEPVPGPGRLQLHHLIAGLGLFGVVGAALLSRLSLEIVAWTDSDPIVGLPRDDDDDESPPGASAGQKDAA